MGGISCLILARLVDPTAVASPALPSTDSDQMQYVAYYFCASIRDALCNETAQPDAALGRSAGLPCASANAIRGMNDYHSYHETSAATRLCIPHPERPCDARGGASYLTLWPMTRREKLGLGRAGIWDELLAARDRNWLDLVASQKIPQEDWRPAVRKGGYPIPALEIKDSPGQAIWFDGYTRTYLERDLQEISAVASLPDLRRLMRFVCLRFGQLMNQADLGREEVVGTRGFELPAQGFTCFRTGSPMPQNPQIPSGFHPSLNPAGHSQAGPDPDQSLDTYCAGLAQPTAVVSEKSAASCPDHVQERLIQGCRKFIKIDPDEVPV